MHEVLDHDPLFCYW